MTDVFFYKIKTNFVFPQRGEISGPLGRAVPGEGDRGSSHEGRAEVWGCPAGALAQGGGQGLLLAGLVPTVRVGCEWCSGISGDELSEEQARGKGVKVSQPLPAPGSSGWGAHVSSLRFASETREPGS